MNPGAYLWRALGEDAVLPDVLPGWAARLGPDHARMGALLDATTRRATWWPCGKGRDGCVRRLVEEPGGYTAACDSEDWACAAEPVNRAQTVLHALRPDRLYAALAVGLGLDARRQGEIGGAPVVRLGARQFGNEMVRVYYAPVARTDVLDAVSVAEQDDQPALAVLVTAAEPPARSGDAAEARRIDLRPLGGWATLGVDGTVAFDLDGFLLTHRFEGVDPSVALSPEIRLILDPVGDRGWWTATATSARSEFPFPSKAATQWKLVKALADRAGADVPRSVLLPAVYPGEFSMKRLDQAWDKKLRQVKDDFDGRAPDLISTVAGSMLAGGFKMTLKPSEIGWWSDLPDSGRGRRDLNRRRK